LVQVAKAAGVSNTTASYVLNGLAKKNHISEATANRVETAAAEMDYRPNRWARNLVRKRTNTIGALFGNLKNDWADRALTGMRAVLDDRGFLLFLTTHQLDSVVEQREIDTLLQLQVEAIICPALPDSLDAYQKLLSQNIPLVFLETKLDDLPEASSVVWDGEKAAYAGVRHIIETGCRRIGFLGREYPRPKDAGRYMPWFHAARYEGYRRALNDADLPAKPEWMGGVLYGESATDTVRRMFAGGKDRPDAIFATLDSLALEAIRTLRALGLRVPEDVAVVGMGDQPAGGDLGAGLTTVRGPDEQLGREAAEVALQLIEDTNASPIHRLIDSNQIVVRRSSIPGMSSEAAY